MFVKFLFQKPLSICLFLFFILNMFFVSPSRAMSLTTYSSRYLYTPNTGSLKSRALKYSCSLYVPQEKEVPCQSSLLFVNNDKKFFWSDLYVNDDISTLDEYRRLVEGNKNIELLKSLFENGDFLSVMASGSLGYRASKWSLSFTTDLSYHSNIVNPSLPHLYVKAYYDKSLILNLGEEVEEVEGLSIGTRFRFVDREFIDDDFTLFDVISDPDAVFNSRVQRILFIEPSVSYAWSSDWSPQVSLQISNMGVTEKKYPEISTAPIFDFGVGVSPPVDHGIWGLGLSTRYSSITEYRSPLVHFSSQYSLGDFVGIIGFDKVDSSIGIFGYFENIHTGLVYTKSYSDGYAGTEHSYDTLMLEWSWIL